MRNKVIIITSVHRWDDTRIFHRQATSLAQYFDVELHAPAEFRKKYINGLKVLGLPKWKNVRDRIKIWLLLIKRLIRCDAEIVHFHDPELILLGVAVKLALRRKVVYDVHEHILYDIADKFWIPNPLKNTVICIFSVAEKICVKIFDATVYTTEIVGERYKKLTKNAISIENYSKKDVFFSEQYSKNRKTKLHGNPTVIYLGRVSNIRGVDQVITSFKYVVDKIPNAKFQIIGDIVPDSYMKSLIRLSNKFGIEKNIEFIGYVPHIESIKYLKMADCGVVLFRPVRNNIACLPNKLFEYMACGLPVVASNFKLYRDVVDSYRCGITVDPEKIEEIANAIIYLLKNPNIRNEMGDRGIKAFESVFNWEQEEVKLLKLYNELLDNK